MLASLFGAVIGGLFALAGGWFALKWQSEREARGVAAALLAELSVAQRMLEQTNVAEFYQQMLDQWKSTGEILDRQAIIDMFDSQPQDVLPVYYSMAGKLGLLPHELASTVVEYYAGIVALPRTIVRFLGKRELSPEVVKQLAHSIEFQYNKTTAMRSKLIVELTAYAGQDNGQALQAPKQAVTAE